MSVCIPFKRHLWIPYNRVNGLCTKYWSKSDFIVIVPCDFWSDNVWPFSTTVWKNSDTVVQLMQLDFLSRMIPRKTADDIWSNKKWILRGLASSCMSLVASVSNALFNFQWLSLRILNGIVDCQLNWQTKTSFDFISLLE